MRPQLLSSLVVLLAAVLPAQSIVKNGDFGSGFAPWKVTGLMVTPKIETFDVTGSGASPAFAVTPTGTAGGGSLTSTMSQTLTVTPNAAYEIAVDVAIVFPTGGKTADRITVSYPTTGGWRRIGGGLSNSEVSYSPASVAGSTVHHRLFTSAMAAQSTTVPITLNFTANYIAVAGTSPRVYLDNVLVRTSRKPYIAVNLRTNSALTVKGPILMVVHGTPGVLGAVWVSPRPLNPSVSLPGFTGSLQIDPTLAVPVFSGVFDTLSGMLRATFSNLPSSVAGIPIYVQAVEANSILKVANLGWAQVFALSK